MFSLDVGCGVHPRGTINCDVTRDDPQGHRHSSRIRKIKNFVLCDARALPFRSAVFDYVRSYQVIEHIPDPERAIGEFIRVSRAKIKIETYHKLSNKLQINRSVRRWFQDHHVANIDFSYLRDVARRHNCTVEKQRVLAVTRIPFAYLGLFSVPAEILVVLVKNQAQYDPE